MVEDKSPTIAVQHDCHQHFHLNSSYHFLVGKIFSWLARSTWLFKGHWLWVKTLSMLSERSLLLVEYVLFSYFPDIISFCCRTPQLYCIFCILLQLMFFNVLFESPSLIVPSSSLFLSGNHLIAETELLMFKTSCLLFPVHIFDEWMPIVDA